MTFAASESNIVKPAAPSLQGKNETGTTSDGPTTKIVLVFASLGVLGGLLITVATFLPWISVTAPFVGVMTKSGIDLNADGIVTLVLGVTALVMGGVQLAYPAKSWPGLTAAASATLAAWIAGADLVSVDDKVASMSTNPYLHASAGGGLYLVLVGSTLGLIGGIFAAMMRG